MRLHALCVRCFFHDHLVGVAAAVVFFLLVVRLAPETFRQILDSLGNIGGFIYRILAELWGVWCVLTFIPWKFVYTFRAIFFSTTLGVLSLGTLHIIVDSVPVAQALTEKFPRLAPWLATAKEFLNQHEPSLRIDVALLVLALVVFWHTIVEFLHSLRREEVPKFLGELVSEFDRFRKENPTPDQKAKNAYLQKLMTNTTTLLDKNGKRKIMISIMAEETAKDSSGQETRTGYLKVDPIPTGTRLATDLRLRVADLGNKKFQGEGAAGRAFYHQAPVYIPKVFYQVGVRLDKVRSLGATYVHSNDPIPQRSMLSVPVVIAPNLSIGGAVLSQVVPTKRSVAVITAASSRAHEFTRDDVRILELAAVFISTMY